MRSLEEIVSDNREAVAQGHAVAQHSVGAGNVAIVLYDVHEKATGKLIVGRATLAGIAQHRVQVNNGEYELTQVAGAPPRSGGQRGHLATQHPVKPHPAGQQSQ